MENDKQKTILAAADFFNAIARKAIVTEHGLHAETLIASVARISGSLMYRSFKFDLTVEPGTSVLSDQANIHGPALMNMMLTTLNSLGSKIQEGNLIREYASAKYSQLSFKESHERLAPFFLKYCEVAPMSYYDAAIAGAVATAILVHDCRTVLDVEKGGSIAVYGFVEGTKTAPYPTETNSNSASKTE